MVYTSERAKNNFAIITGASQGLGRAFALELAKRKLNTLLVSLPNENLNEVVSLSRAMGIECHGYETDLTQKDNVLELAQWINLNFNAFMLINNAGRGGSQSFIRSKVEYIDGLIQLNIMATTLLTHQLLPNLMQRNAAYILNISSMASFTPTGFKTVYPASKRFIQHFSRGLCEELKHSNVFVSVAHPGPMKTSEDIIHRIECQGILARCILRSPEEVAKVCVRQLLRHDNLIFIGWTNKISWLLLSFMPVWLKMTLMTKAVKRELNEA